MRKAFEVHFLAPPATAADDDAESDEEEDTPSVSDRECWTDLDVLSSIVTPNLAVHIRCFAHSLQLAVKDGLKQLKKLTLVGRCSKISSLLHTSTTFKVCWVFKVIGLRETLCKTCYTQFIVVRISLFHQRHARANFQALAVYHPARWWLLVYWHIYSIWACIQSVTILLFYSLSGQLWGRVWRKSKVDTRWNSMYVHLRTISLLDQGKLNRALDRSKASHCKLGNLEHQQLTDIMALLKPFYEVTQRTQGEKVIYYNWNLLGSILLESYFCIRS